MSAEKSTNRARPLQASNVFRDSVEQGQPTMTPPASLVGSTDVQLATPPRAIPSGTSVNSEAQSLPSRMQDVISLECGRDYRIKYPIHEYRLCEHSQFIRQLSTKAQAPRKIYDQCNDLLDRVESITMVGLTAEMYQEKKLDKKLLPLITTVGEKYPLPRHQEAISKAINTVIDLQFADKNVNQTGKNLKSKKEFQNLSLGERLALLNSEGALEVAEELCTQLQRVHATEKQSAKSSIGKAMAQRRILLRDVSEKAVSSLVEWACDQRDLHYDNAEHLYDLYLLATRLKFDELAEQSLDRLFTHTSSCIDYTLASGLTLRCLLWFGSSEEEDPTVADPQTDDVVATVFRHVLQDQDPPERLLQLVIDVMATCMDSRLWAELKTTVSQNIAHQLVGIMVAHREIKNDQNINPAKRIKLESHHATDDALTTTVDAHHGSTPAG